MSNVNYVALALNNEEKFISELNNATLSMFNDVDCEVLFEDSKRQIKAYRDDENKTVYIFDKINDKIEVLEEKIHSFNNKKSIKKIIGWDYIASTNEVGKLYKDQVIVCDFNRQDFDNTLTEEEFEKRTYQGKSVDKCKELDSFFKDIKQIFGKKYLQDSKFLNDFLHVGVNCTNDVSSIQEYVSLLSNKKYMKDIEQAFFKNLILKSLEENQPKLCNWVIELNSLLQSCSLNQFKNYDSAYSFGSDNVVWTEKNQLILSSQNIAFYIQKNDDENFIIYTLDKEYEDIEKEIRRINKAIKSNTINELKDIFLKVKDGKIVYINDSQTNIFDLLVKNAVKSMKKKNLLTIDYPVDITSYEYQKDYYYHKLGLNEFAFIAYAMMTVSGGFDYDKDKGIFVSNSIEYIPNLPKSPNTRNDKIEKIDYLNPKKITYLNKDWLNAIKFAVDVLKKDNPKPIVFYEAKNEVEALDNAIKYFESKIEKLEKPKLKM